MSVEVIWNLVGVRGAHLDDFKTSWVFVGVRGCHLLKPPRTPTRCGEAILGVRGCPWVSVGVRGCSWVSVGVLVGPDHRGRPARPPHHGRRGARRQTHQAGRRAERETDDGGQRGVKEEGNCVRYYLCEIW